MTTNSCSHRGQQSGPATSCELNDQIRAAQHEAGLRKFDDPHSQSQRIDDRIRMAQLGAGMQGSVAPRDLLGRWTDSYGNTVNVKQTDEFGMQLVATLSRPPRPDIYLKFQPVDHGAGWHCGDATLDATLSQNGTSVTDLFWAFPDGNVSVWVREPNIRSEDWSDYVGHTVLHCAREFRIMQSLTV